MPPMPAESPVVATVVVTYNRKALLRECLAANLCQSRPADVLVVVDNASTDGTVEMLEGEGWLTRPGVLLHRLGTNRGGAGGFHAGMEKALERGVDWIWLMDDDAIPERDALERLLVHAKGEPSYPLLASQVLDRAGTLDITHRARIHRLPFRISHIPASAYAGVGPTADAVTFVGPLIHRQHMVACGLPRADYFLYYDDFEYTHRLRRAGFALRIVPQSRIRHLDEGRSLRQADAMGDVSWAWRMFYRVRNRVHWYREAEPRAWALWPGFVAVFLANCGLILLRQPSKGQRLRLLVRAFQDGWRGRLGKTIDPALYREET